MPQRALNANELLRIAEMIRVLGHPLRLRLVEALQRGECCVSELQEALGLPQAIVSQQLARLKAAGIVTCRRDGVNVRYVVAEPRVLGILKCITGAPAARPARLTYTRTR